ncbi:MAG: hypothetical protein F4Y01_08640 [Gammaproteobacteria bacterium]|nr:hypothetical protein [Gammaproteobacteria bacterium]
MLVCLLALAASQAGGEEAAGANETNDLEPAAPEVSDSDVQGQDDLAPLTPRQRYNSGRERLAGGDPVGAADALLSARDEAGADAELRYRAAFNLGLALAAQADAAAEEPERAVGIYRDSAAWFADAVRGAAEGDDDARVNLELVQRRIQQLADQLNQGRGLEQRLERAIDDQRDLRDRLRRMLAATPEPGSASRDFNPLATQARTLLADASDIAGLAGEERALLDSIDEAERSPEETVRAVQLLGLESHVNRARQSISDSRRRLRTGEGERAHRRADAALAELKRAYEQLLHPVTVLKAVAADELSLAADTSRLANFNDAGIRLEPSEDANAAGPPGWLTADHLGDRQEDALVRSVEVLARFESAASTPPPAAGTHDPEAARLVVAAKEATPPLTEAVEAMRSANQALERNEPASALGEQVAALQALSRAIERFAGVRELIELAHAEQAEATALLDPESDLQQMEDSGARLLSIAAANEDRLARLNSLLAQELEATGDGEAGGAEEPPPERQRAEVARQLTASAQDAVQRFEERAIAEADALGRCSGAERASEPCRQARSAVHAPADEALTHIAELRRLYYTIVEHLRELGMAQAETHDRTATVQFERKDAEGAAPAASEEPAASEAPADGGAPSNDGEPPPGAIAARQGSHAATADAIAAALAAEADATSTPNPGQGGAAPPPFAEAAREVRQAAGFMHSASAVLGDASSTDWEPTLADQLDAMDHIAAAIALLQPPNQGENQQGQNSQGAHDQQSEDDEQMSRRQALKRLQAIRDRDAERQRRRQTANSSPDPVEKDW